MSTQFGAALAAALLLLGCGSDDEKPKSSQELLLGKWAAELPGSAPCIFAGAFLPDGVYEADTICELADGAYGVEAEVGNYVAGDAVIEFTPTAASCREPDRNHAPSRVSYQVSEQTLRLVLPAGLIVLERLGDSDGSSVVARYGCANADGFVPSEIAPL